MKTYDVLLTEQAEKDLDGIFEYIAFTLEEFENAKRQIARIQKAIEGLETMPERHKAYEKGSWKNRNTHYFRSIIIMFSIQWTMYLKRFPYLGLCTVPEISMPSCFTIRSISRLMTVF